MFSAAKTTTKTLIAGLLWIWGIYYTYKSKGYVQIIGFFLLSGSNLLIIIHGIVMMSLVYKYGLKNVPNLPSNWYIRRPREEWEGQKILIWIDFFNIISRLLYLFSVIYIINGWEINKDDMWIKRSIGICMCFMVLISTIIIHNIIKNDIVLKAIMPQVSLFIGYIVVIMMASITMSSIVRLCTKFEKKYSNNKKLHQNPYHRKYIGLLFQMKYIKITYIWLLIGLGLECGMIGLLLLDVVTKSNFLIFSGGLGLDIIETLETIGWSISVASIYILCSDRGH